ncbi:MAG: hypothetical protein KDE53_28095, partial [Caldilineaceae bacterium]|nr:hypothetical protein [Caldilineaceae bacterium]
MIDIDLWRHRILLSLVSLSLVILMNGCFLTFSNRANDRLKELKSVANVIPTISGSELLDEKENIIRSHVPQCARIQILQLYGTDTMEFKNVIDYYKSQVDQKIWQVKQIDESGIRFIGPDRFELGLTSNLNSPFSLGEDIQTKRAEF